MHVTVWSTAGQSVVPQASSCNKCQALFHCVQAAFLKHGSMVLDQLVRVLQNVSEEEAQALPNKDPERPGVYDRVCNMMVCCGA